MALRELSKYALAGVLYSMAVQCKVRLVRMYCVSLGMHSKYGKEDEKRQGRIVPHPF